MGSKQSDEKETPQELFDFLAQRYGALELDVCASRSNRKCDRYYGLDNGRDGLDLPWDRPFWCNPPYSDIMPWAEKVHHEAVHGGACGLVLVPADPSTRWSGILWECAIEVAYLSPRVTFIENGESIGTGAKQPSAVYVFGPSLLKQAPPRFGRLRWRQE